MLCTILHHLVQFKKCEKHPWNSVTSSKVAGFGVSFFQPAALSKRDFKACNFTKSNTPIWAFFTFFKLYKWY